MKRRRERFAKWRHGRGIQRAEIHAMPVAAAEVVASLICLYAAVGLTFAIGFVSRGVTRIDPQAAGSPWSFRLLILPGTALF
jgi:hypothetical protein